MAKKSETQKKPIKANSTKEDVTKQESKKGLSTNLRNLIYFDRLFRLDLTEARDGSGNTQADIARQVVADNKRFGKKIYPEGKQIIKIKQDFESLGARFRKTSLRKQDKHKSDENDEFYTYYEYERSEGPQLLGLINLIGKELTDLEEYELKAFSPTDNAHLVWKKLYVQELLKNRSATSAEYVSFNENLDHVGFVYFEPLLQHIMNRQPLEIRYQPYGKASKKLHIHPYYLKNYNQRWFLLALTKNDNPRLSHPEEYYGLSCYAIDRIREEISPDGKVIVTPAIKEWNVPFVESPEEVDDFFYNIIGVTKKGDVQTVILRLTPERYEYVRTKPMSPTQKDIKPGNKYFDENKPTISLEVDQNNELVQQILSFGPDMEVLAPQSLRETVAKNVKQMMNRYEYI